MTHSNNSGFGPVKYTLINSTGNAVSKVLAMDAKGERLMLPSLSANISSGKFWTWEVPAETAVDTFGANILHHHGTPNLLILPGHHATLAHGDITTAGSRHESPTCVARTEANFKWRKGLPSLLPIDVDFGFDAATASPYPDEADRMLIDAAPYLAPYRRFWKPSSSSHVVLTGADGVGRWVNPKFKWHCFFAISEAAKAKAIGADIFIRTFEGPHGYVKLGDGEKRCLLYDLSLIDNTIYTGNRELFEFGAILTGPGGIGTTDPRLSQPHAEYSKCFGEVQIIDVRKLPKLLTMAAFKASPKRLRLRAEMEPKRIARNAQIAGPQIVRLEALGMPHADAVRAVAESQREGKVVNLHSEFELMTSHGRAFLAGDTYTDPSLQSKPGEGIPCRDPMEPEYSKTAGKLYAGMGQTSGDNYISSKAHGIQTTYRLMKRPEPLVDYVPSPFSVHAVPFNPAPQGAPVAGVASVQAPTSPSSAALPPAPQGTPVAGVTGAEGFDPSVRHHAGPLPDAGALECPQTRQDFVNLITATDQNVDGGFEALTEEIPALMAAASWLTEAACDQLFKMIAAKTTAKPATIKRAYDKAKSDNEDLDPIESQQLIIAKKVIADCYENGLNIITSEYGVRAWNGGYWEKLHEQTVRKQIHGAALVLAAGAQISDSAVKSIYALIKTETFNNIKFDEPAHFINVANGEIHLVAGVWVMFPALREHYRTSQLPVAFDPDAVCPVFDALLTSLFESDPDCEEKVNCLLEMMGYTLTTLTSYEKFIILVGNGANGKSMVFNIMKALLGPKAIAAIQPAQFGDTFKTSHLEGKLANMVTEIKKNATLKDDIMKALTSGETVTAEKKFMDPFDFNNHATMWLGCNELPKMDDFTQGMFRRTIIIPMNEIFGIKGKPLSATSTRVATQDADPDLKLIERGEGPLAAELPGILNMALAALAGLIERKGVFTEANSSRARLRQWRDDNDNVAAFIADKCVTGLQCRCGSSELYRHYDTYARGRGEPAVTQTAFVRYLKTNTEVSVARTSSHNDLAGIGLKISDAILPTYTPAPAPHIPKISGEWPTATKH